MKYFRPGNAIVNHELCFNRSTSRHHQQQNASRLRSQPHPLITTSKHKNKWKEKESKEKNEKAAHCHCEDCTSSTTVWSPRYQVSIRQPPGVNKQAGVGDGEDSWWKVKQSKEWWEGLPHCPLIGVSTENHQPTLLYFINLSGTLIFSKL